MVLSAVAGLAIAMVVTWLVLAVALWMAGRRLNATPATVLGVLPSTMRLLRSLLADRSLPGGIRWRVGLAVVYCGQPFNLIPDFIPVIGYLDNVVVAGWALRSVIRLAGIDAVRQRWPGGAEGLWLLCRVMRLESADLGAVSVSSEPE